MKIVSAKAEKEKIIKDIIEKYIGHTYTYAQLEEDINKHLHDKGIPLRMNINKSKIEIVNEDNSIKSKNY